MSKEFKVGGRVLCIHALNCSIPILSLKKGRIYIVKSIEKCCNTYISLIDTLSINVTCYYCKKLLNDIFYNMAYFIPIDEDEGDITIEELLEEIDIKEPEKILINENQD